MKLTFAFVLGLLVGSVLFASPFVSADPCGPSSYIPDPSSVDRTLAEFHRANPLPVEVYPAFPSGARSTYGTTGGLIP
jgi:hypothetical protein